MDIQTGIGVEVEDNESFLQDLSEKENSDAELKKHINLPFIDGSTVETDHGLLVSDIKETQDLGNEKETQFPPKKGFEEWFDTHSLTFQKLTLMDLISQGTAVLNKNNSVMQKIHFPIKAVSHFESRLSEAIKTYEQRIQWLMEGSKKVFGFLKGTKVGVLVDVSNVSCNFQMQEFQRDLLNLIDDQLSKKEHLYLVSFGTQPSALWPNPVKVNKSTLQEAKEWVQMLQPRGGSNLLQSLRKVFMKRELDSLVVIIGSCPDQSPEILSDYILQCTLGRNLDLHTITYKCSNYMPLAVVRNFAESIKGHYHSYKPSPEDQNSANSDIVKILKEIQQANNILGTIKEMYQSRTCEAFTSMAREISAEFTKLPISSFLPKPPKHEGPLKIKIPNFLTRTSEDWLKSNGLKAKKLTLFQILAPNAFFPVEEFVPILQKTVPSTLHEKVMMQFEWYDGTVKNIPVDLPLLYDYQKQLNNTIQIYERRIEWLSISSRRIWGTVCEKRYFLLCGSLTLSLCFYSTTPRAWVVILVDLSVTNSMYIIHIQHSLRLLLEEQLSNKDCFNIIAFGSIVESWRPEMVPLSQENLQSAWCWILTLNCKGSRNVLGAMRKAIEVDFKEKEKFTSQGIYLFTGGVSDQEMPLVSTYIAETCRGCDLRIHVCLFHINELDMDGAVPARYANSIDTASAYKDITHAANGRFHWFGDTGIFESDDISAIALEMEKAINYSQKCALLVAALKSQPGSSNENPPIPKEELKVVKEKSQPKPQPRKLYCPKPNTLTLGKMGNKSDLDRDKIINTKNITWHPNTTKPTIPSGQLTKDWNSNKGKKKIKPPKKGPATSFSLFVLDQGKDADAAHKKNLPIKVVKKPLSSTEFPQNDDISSSEEWLASCSLRKLKLELPRFLFGPNSIHQKKMEDALQKQISSKTTSFYPMAEIKGMIKHLQCQDKDLEEYIEVIEKTTMCYIRRIHWLLTGSRRLFGTILESKVCIMIDLSESMGSHLQQVKKELNLLIWEQLRKCDSFNLLGFAEDLYSWQDRLVHSTDEACHRAVQWVTKLETHGTTSILRALLKAFTFQDVKGLYLLTDGRSDSSCNLILSEVEKLRKKKNIKVHSISFNNSSNRDKETRLAIGLLKKISINTGGRYHHCQMNFDDCAEIHRLLTGDISENNDTFLQLFEGDDLKKLAQEIFKAKHFLRQAQDFRVILQKKKTIQERDVPI
ncbi:von Willebrand factor A domain-containing protein 3A [Gracilinanus agilis]|uniref:von Willebrand factor A domain-containing protein 3A n=1 Tax=Gracilinanus agilis TaxID=191870 RepID=UPI001CFD26CD|nr:von Willebrand factor A domain-containing protein 3A [Gracilinanus agilis]